jgi:amidase
VSGTEDIVDLDAGELSRAIQAREVSCVEVMGAHLARIEALNPTVNAIVELQPAESLMAQARARDEDLRQGRSAGPLHGFPHAVKDLQMVAGMRATQGSPIFKDFTSAADSLPVERLRRAGVIFVGKTNTPEFGLGSHTFNPVHGLTRNPWDPTRSAGGSSGGAAVALALRMVPLADGSDYGGSLRNPAGWNNVLGFRPSIGRVPALARDDWSPSIGVTGPMARTVDDLALLLGVLAGFDPRSPLSLDGDPKAFATVARRDMRGSRIGWLADFGGAAPCEAGVLEVCEATLKTFADLGCVVEAAAPDFDADRAWRAFLDIRGWQAGSSLFPYYRDPATRDLLKPEAVFEVESGLALSAYDVAAASAVRSAWGASVRKLFEQFDFLIAPTAQVFPFDAEERWPRAIAGRTMATYHEWMKGVCLVSLTGCPSLAMPAGFSASGLPMGLQIIAPVQQEQACLTLAAAYEAASQWTKTHLPPLLPQAPAEPPRPLSGSDPT